MDYPSHRDDHLYLVEITQGGQREMKSFRKCFSFKVHTKLFLSVSRMLTAALFSLPKSGYAAKARLVMDEEIKRGMSAWWNLLFGNKQGWSTGMPQCEMRTAKTCSTERASHKGPCCTIPFTWDVQSRWVYRRGAWISGCTGLRGREPLVLAVWANFLCGVTKSSEIYYGDGCLSVGIH